MTNEISVTHKRCINRIRILRLDNGWSQKETANHLDMKPTSYSDLEQGAKRIDLDKLITIANVFKVPVGFLANGERDGLSFKRKEQIGRLFDL